MSSAAGGADSCGGDPASSPARRPIGGIEPADPLDAGDPPADLRRLAVRAAGPVMYGLFVLQPLALTVQYSFYRWDGVGPATWVGLANYAAVLEEPKLVETLFNAFRLVVFFSFAPVALGLVDRERHPSRGNRPARRRLAHRAVPAAGHPARRCRDHLGPAAVALRARQPGPDGPRAGRRRAGLARRLRHGASGGRADRDLGRCSASARCCC